SNIGTVLTGGIQDISALLLLLSTEQCEEHRNIAAGLSKGFLYSAASPLSIFGRLGIARAGLKILVASITIPKWNFNGARKLKYSGFST
ncbi:hypothetical protein M422DRAFT_142928, partial [Sphaerobolus stellatus SS14]